MDLRVRALIIFGVLLMIVPCISEAKIVSVSAGLSHVLALDDDGTVWAWGYNQHGELGDGSTSPFENTPQKVLIDNVTAMSAATGGFNLALKLDGTVWAWGSGELGSLGDGSTDSHPVPVQVGNLTGVIAIAAGQLTGYALKNDGTVWAWGYNVKGEVGDGTIINRLSPVQVQGLTDIKVLGEHGRYALKSDGTLYTWGDFSGTNLTPCPMSEVNNIRMVTSGDDYVLMVKNDGTVWGWCNALYVNMIGGDFKLGTNDKGQLGDGTIIASLTPVQAKVSGIKYISAGGNHNVALKNDGTVWEWGQRNDGTSYDKNVPKPGQVDDSSDAMPDPRQVNGLHNIVAVSSGGIYCVALDKDGVVWGWGTNNYGVLRDNKGAGPQSSWIVTPVRLFESSGSGTPIITPTVSAVDSPVPSSQAGTSSPYVSASPTAGPNSTPTPGMGIGTALFAMTAVAGTHVILSVRKKKNQ